MVAHDMADPVLDRCDLDRRNAAAARLAGAGAVERLHGTGAEQDEGKSEGEDGGRSAPEACRARGERPVR